MPSLTWTFWIESAAANSPHETMTFAPNRSLRLSLYPSARIALAVTPSQFADT